MILVKDQGFERSFTPNDDCVIGRYSHGIPDSGQSDGVEEVMPCCILSYMQACIALTAFRACSEGMKRKDDSNFKFTQRYSSQR